MKQPDRIVALDLGGTQLRVTLADTQGKFSRRLARPTEARKGPEALITKIVNSIEEITESIGISGLAGVGIGAAAPVNPVEGLVYTSAVLPGWEDLPLKAILEERLECPVFVDNDANLAALGEARFGAGKGFRNIIYLTVSTGIGAGIIENGRILSGANGLAGELGHITVDVNGPVCACGNVGCLNNYASGSVIRNKARKALEQGQVSLLQKLSEGDLQKVDARMVALAASQNDSLALGILEQAGKYLGVGITNILHMFNPEVIIIGGGTAQIGDLLLNPMRDWVARHAIPAYRQSVAIVPAQLGDDSGLYGAAALVIQNQHT